MVSRIPVISRFNANPPVTNAPANRKIEGGPLYPPAEVLDLLNSNAKVLPWTKKCRSDVQRLSLEDALPELLKAAIEAKVYNDSEWCVGQNGGPWAACDVYILCRTEIMEASKIELKLTYYLKFAIAKTGNILLLASCHLSED